jgi:hypothetical protein
VTPDAHVALATGQVLRLDDPGPIEVACDAGRVWLTEEAQASDTWLVPGMTARIAGRGLALLEALAPARLRIVGKGASRT